MSADPHLLAVTNLAIFVGGAASVLLVGASLAGSSLADVCEDDKLVDRTVRLEERVKAFARMDGNRDDRLWGEIRQMRERVTALREHK